MREKEGWVYEQLEREQEGAGEEQLEREQEGSGEEQLEAAWIFERLTIIKCSNPLYDH